MHWLTNFILWYVKYTMYFWFCMKLFSRGCEYTLSHYKTLSCLSVSPVMTWWRHQMETFSALLAICAGNSPVPGEFPTQRPVTRSFDVFFDLRMNKRLSKQPWGWWFETPAWSLWRNRNDIVGPGLTFYVDISYPFYFDWFLDYMNIILCWVTNLMHSFKKLLII